VEVENPGNLFAIFAFIVWVPIAILGARRWSAAAATAYLLVGSALLLPETVWFKPAGLPPFAKVQLSVLWTTIGLLLFHRDRLRSIRWGRGPKIAIAVLCVGIVLTILTNQDPVVLGSALLPAHVPYDSVHHLITTGLVIIVPFVLGVAMFRGPRDLRVLFSTLATAALLYTVFQLIELRFSPQLHNWIYGAHQHSFDQTVRGSGYRPMAFMTHGLALAMFTLFGTIAATTLYKTKGRVWRFRAGRVALYLTLILLLSKSIAAALYMALALSAVLFLSPKNQSRAAVALAIVFLSYPMIRSSGLMPVDQILEFVGANLGEDKFSSLETRFSNEEELLARAKQRPLFGWGTYCRSCKFDYWTGQMASTLDGDWIITLGVYGFVGFYSKFGLLLLPVFLCWRRIGRLPKGPDARFLAALSLMVGFGAIDLLPNGNYNCLVYLLSGALYGCLSGTLRQLDTFRQRRRAAQLAARQQQAQAVAQPA
jgi:hypothetical protein